MIIIIKAGGGEESNKMGYGVNVFAVAVFLVAAIVSTDGQQVQLPQPNCNAPSELQMNDTCGADCWSTYINPSQMFADCRDFSTNVSLSFPSPACCSGVVNASTYFLPRCFCRYVFHPASNMGIIPARRLALPQLCNVTDLCQMCTSLKPAPPCGAISSGKLNHHALVLTVTLTITALVVGMVAGAISLYIWFVRRYKTKPHLRFPDSTQPDTDDMLKIEEQHQRG
ncbi:hypothetical protein CY35_19G077400 [Sphagnum magellanicum]|nr:hypothetical protein CY35_19G077400 [Sphagnum magellanicum]KAH9532192.1 hypothetical protein CY35_19G077400 [Sphagnum magellanicum]